MRIAPPGIAPSLAFPLLGAHRAHLSWLQFGISGADQGIAREDGGAHQGREGGSAAVWMGRWWVRPPCYPFVNFRFDSFHHLV